MVSINVQVSFLNTILITEESVLNNYKYRQQYYDIYRYVMDKSGLNRIDKESVIFILWYSIHEKGVNVDDI